MRTIHLIAECLAGACLVTGLFAIFSRIRRTRASRNLGAVSLGFLALSIGIGLTVKGMRGKPMGYFLLTLAAIPGITAILLKPRVSLGLCKTCGYNLTGNVSGKCSECGEPVVAR